MPADMNSPRGNHFGSAPRGAQGGTGGGPSAPKPSPSDTMQFMNAASAGRAGGPQAQNDAPQGFQPAGPRPSASRASAPQAAAPINAARPANGAGRAGGTYGSQPAGGNGGKKKGRGKIIAAVASAIVLVILVAGGFMGFSLYQDAKGMMDKSKAVLATVGTLKDSLKEGDGEALKAGAEEVAQVASELKQTVNGPLWNVATFVPVYGQDVKLAKDLLTEVDNLAQNALLPASESLAGFKLGNLMADGAVNIELLNSLISTMQEVEPVVAESAAVIQELPDAHIGKINDLLGKVKEPMGAAVDTLAQVNDLAPLLPRMLGAEGPRNYLITAENNAEIRAQGGFAGALGIMTVDNGRISLNEFEGTLTMGADGPTSAITITDEEMALFQPEAQTLNYTSGDSYFVPDFPRGAQLVSTLWSVKHGGQHIDGVVALDPIFLQYLLQLTGGITAIDGMQVDGTNAASALLSLTYWNYPKDGKMQDAVFASVAAGAFDKLLGGLGDVGFQRLFAVLTRGIDEGRLLMWMANEEEQAVVKTFGADGALPIEANNPQAGLYVNNYSYSKLDWYLNIDTQVGDAVKQADGSTAYTVNATLTNEMTADEAANLPAYVKAHSPFADAPTQELLRLYLYAPYGGSITDVNCSYGEMKDGTHNNLQVKYRDIRMMPGESVTVSYTVVVPAGAEGELDLRVTPTAQYARKGTAGDATTPGTVQGEVAE